jgi:hypothetical protein
MIIMFLMLYCLFKALFAEYREGTLPSISGGRKKRRGEKRMFLVW